MDIALNRGQTLELESETKSMNRKHMESIDAVTIRSFYALKLWASYTLYHAGPDIELNGSSKQERNLLGDAVSFSGRRLNFDIAFAYRISYEQQNFNTQTHVHLDLSYGLVSRFHKSMIKFFWGKALKSLNFSSNVMESEFRPK